MREGLDRRATHLEGLEAEEEGRGGHRDVDLRHPGYLRGEGGNARPALDCSHSVRAVEKRRDESEAVRGGVLAQAAAR